MIILTGYSSEIGIEIFKTLEKNNFIFLGRRKPVLLRKRDLWVNHDLTKLAFNNKLFNILKKEKIDGFINVAAHQSGRIKLKQLDEKEIINAINVNIYSPLIIIKKLLELEIKNSNIVLIGSEAAVYGGNNISAYAISKSALHCFPKSLSKELGENNNRINVVSPSVIETKVLKKNSDIKRVIESIALKRLGQPKEVAELVAWLMSKKSSYINGAIIPITGGR